MTLESGGSVNDQYAYIALNMITGIGPIKVRALIESFGSPASALNADEETLRRVPGIGAQLAHNIWEQGRDLDPADEIRKAKKLGARIITPLDDEYPAMLRTIHDPPLALYVLGEFLSADEHALAMVGSRRCSHYGRSVADRLAYQLAKVGYTIVSGLARGIDTASHQGALKGAGRTIAVLGGALDCLYPQENEALAKQIAGNGVVVSEYPLGREPDRTTFPYRTRIVSGISQGVIVVEAPRKSGSLITVDCALEQGRHVFAVPGRIDSPMAGGCHQVIKNGARLVENVDDILEEFEMLIPVERQEQARNVTKRPEIHLTGDEEKVVRALGDGALDVDSLAACAGLNSATVSGLLLGLEMKRIVRMMPGQMVALAVSADEF